MGKGRDIQGEAPTGTFKQRAGAEADSLSTAAVVVFDGETHHFPFCHEVHPVRVCSIYFGVSRASDFCRLVLCFI